MFRKLHPPCGHNCYTFGHTRFTFGHNRYTFGHNRYTFDDYLFVDIRADFGPMFWQYCIAWPFFLYLQVDRLRQVQRRYQGLSTCWKVVLSRC
jgi:hypothetical protein